MIKKLVACLIIMLFCCGCGDSDKSKKDPMRNWGTKKSTAEPMKDFPGAPADNKWNNKKDK